MNVVYIMHRSIGWLKMRQKVTLDYTGRNKLNDIVRETIKLYNEDMNNKKWIDFYSDGKASDRIARVLINESK